jgi:hypothetical protein
MRLTGRNCLLSFCSRGSSGLVRREGMGTGRHPDLALDRGAISQALTGLPSRCLLLASGSCYLSVRRSHRRVGCGCCAWHHRLSDGRTFHRCRGRGYRRSGVHRLMTGTGAEGERPEQQEQSLPNLCHIISSFVKRRLALYPGISSRISIR